MSRTPFSKYSKYTGPMILQEMKYNLRYGDVWGDVLPAAKGSLFYVFSFHIYIGYLYIQVRLGNRFATFLWKELPTLLAICSFCGCFIVFVCLFPWGFAIDLTVSVPEFFYLPGNLFPKRWQLCYPNLTEYIFNLHNCLNKNIWK